ncbi:Uncharacterised protein [Legionella beliardensis]|uniref:Uncharacterized protein n=1 Tax=Legionella beliardensis TaxID=91822 RepID=A0A378I4F5_9GAMM|nr:hypothetical protein [Legionella beliardensis]STX29576.1 Uncharacterised protein [Legionella beliardensis]
MVMVTWKEVILASFVKVYPPDGFDPISVQFNGRPLLLDELLPLIAQERQEMKPAYTHFHLTDEEQAQGEQKQFKEKYYDSPITHVTTFLGLPNQCPTGVSQSWSNIAKNFIGWQDNKTTGRMAYNIAKMPLVVPWNLTMAVLKTALNIVKLGTEFLPRAIADSCSKGRRYASDKLKGKNLSTGAKVGYGALYGLAILGQIVSECVYFAGQALTSPIKGVRSAWKLGEKIAGKGIGGKLLGGVLATLSIAVTVTAYAFLWPLAVKTLGPVILSKMPTVISHAINVVVNAISPLMSTVGNYLMPIFGKAFSAMGMTVAPAAVGAAAVAGAALTTVGTTISRFVFDPLKNWWNKSAREKLETKPLNTASKRVVSSKEASISSDDEQKHDDDQKQVGHVPVVQDPPRASRKDGQPQNILASISRGAHDQALHNNMAPEIGNHSESEADSDLEETVVINLKVSAPIDIPERDSSANQVEVDSSTSQDEIKHGFGTGARSQASPVSIINHSFLLRGQNNSAPTGISIKGEKVQDLQVGSAPK